ncbi:putative integrase (plasmid) [Magnetospirillum sp. XM-1]|uniref:site-specific integrase n=1 Tax=Magnetospirillum sp. XM-1 TaxID=1663591 RepID=UPI00073E0DB8|nr:site-specific integrase [Magnetospirillum sp. XM-1]CUW41865.1 putative integrase [Magnetospirillum sp. XM-1]
MTDTSLPAVLETEIFGPVSIPGSMAMTTELAAVVERAAELSRQSRAPNTRRAYRSAWKQYAAWCARFGFEPLGADPAIVALHLSDISKRLAVSTVQLRLAAIISAHRLLGLQLDGRHHAIASVLGGAIREKGKAPTRQAKPVRTSVLHRLAAACPDTHVGIRDRAMLLLGFGAACRRSELVALRINDVRLEERGAIVTIRRSKTDQAGEGAVVAIHGSDDPIDDVRVALAEWLAIRGRSTHARRGVPLSDDERAGEAHLFCALSKTGRPLGRKLSDYAVVRMIKEAALRANIDPEGYSGHSLRSGLATSASADGASLAEIMDQGRWRSVDMAKRYVRDEEVWKNAASKALVGRRTKDGE